MRGPLVFRVRRFCLDDGPGIRSTVFFKGCPLACSWCHNPEGISPERTLLVNEARCVGCDACRAACPHGLRFAGTACDACGRCAEACPSGARSVCGTSLPVAELRALLLADRHFFEASGGGVTLSGGEPTLAMEYVGELARTLRESGVSVALETCGHFPWSRFEERLLPSLDLIYFDLKLMDEEAHRLHTGVSNELILANLRRLRAVKGPALVVRTPLVPGITDGTANLTAIRSFLRSIDVREHRLLPFNPARRPPTPGRAEPSGGREWRDAFEAPAQS